MEFQKIPVYCPKCKSRVLHWNGITKMQLTTKCQNCGQLVTYNPEDNTTVAKKCDTVRENASGVRFI